MTVSLLFVWQHAREFGRVDVRHGCCAPQRAFALGRLAAQDVLLERLAAEKLALLGPFEPLRGSAVRFQFRHLTLEFSLPRRRRWLGFPALRLPAQNGVHLVAFETGQRLGDGHVRKILHQPLENAPSNLWVRHLTTAEKDRCLHLVTFVQEAFDVFLLELVVVLVHLGTELDFLDLDDLLMPSCFAGPLLLLVLILAEIHDAADRRACRRRDLDEVEALLLRDGQRLGRRHDAELLPGVVDDANFSYPDSLVHADAIVASRSSIECDKASSFAMAWGPTPMPDAVAPLRWAYLVLPPSNSWGMGPHPHA